MRATDKDPHNMRELARTVILGVKIARRQELGKPTRALEREVERIREKAEKREAARRKK